MEDTMIYNKLVQKLRSFFIMKGFLEVPTQSRLSILAACENPFSISTFEFAGEVYPLPQTGQMWLEKELLSNPNYDGVFCISTSYRDEKDPIPGRHEKIFPMFEFESKGDINDLLKLETQLLLFLGFNKPINLWYDPTCKTYNTDILEDEHETRMWKEYGNSISLQYFPLRTSPFWNMKQNTSDMFNKVDVILYGQETIGSAERSNDPEEMRNLFHTISDGKYAEKLYQLFGKERVEKELEEFLAFKFFPRYGGGIGMTRLARAYKLSLEE